MAEFAWTSDQIAAAQLIADGNLTISEIAEKFGVSRQTIYNWRQIPEFAARVEEHLEEFRQDVRRRGLASREKRIASLNDRWKRLQRVVEERADDPAHAHVPGWKTGLLVHNVKSVGGGDNATVVDLYEVDTGLLRELREHEKQAAQELGQWIEKVEAKNEVRSVGLEDDSEALRRLTATLRDRRGAEGTEGDPGEDVAGRVRD